MFQSPYLTIEGAHPQLDPEWSVKLGSPNRRSQGRKRCCARPVPQGQLGVKKSEKTALIFDVGLFIAPVIAVGTLPAIPRIQHLTPSP
jgi:hypothetical protein